jgi:hypothetical protein
MQQRTAWKIVMNFYYYTDFNKMSCHLVSTADTISIISQKYCNSMDYLTIDIERCSDGVQLVDNIYRWCTKAAMVVLRGVRLAA